MKNKLRCVPMNAAVAILVTFAVAGCGDAKPAEEPPSVTGSEAPPPGIVVGAPAPAPTGSTTTTTTTMPAVTGAPPGTVTQSTTTTTVAH